MVSSVMFMDIVAVIVTTIFLHQCIRISKISLTACKIKSATKKTNQHTDSMFQVPTTAAVYRMFFENTVDSG